MEKGRTGPGQKTRTFDLRPLYPSGSTQVIEIEVFKGDLNGRPQVITDQRLLRGLPDRSRALDSEAEGKCGG